MAKITKYVIKTADTAEELSKIVTDHLNGGWYLVGGVSVTVSAPGGHYKFTYAQALADAKV